MLQINEWLSKTEVPMMENEGRGQKQGTEVRSSQPANPPQLRLHLKTGMAGTARVEGRSPSPSSLSVLMNT